MRAVCFWYINDRPTDEFLEMENLHFEKIKQYNIKQYFDKIDVHISINPKFHYAEHTEFFDKAVRKLQSCLGKNINIVASENSPKYGEFSCYYDMVFKTLKDEIEPIFYFHFKGVKKFDPIFIQSRTKWINILYDKCFSENILNHIGEYSMSGAHFEPCTRSWFEKWLWLGTFEKYKKSYPFLKNLQSTNCGYLDGSFQWINPIKLKEYLFEKGVSIDDLFSIEFTDNDRIRYTHFSEYFLCSILDKSEINAEEFVRTYLQNKLLNK